MIVYQDGQIVEGGMVVNPTDLLFSHGLGFYETLLHNGHMLRHLEPHLRRLFHSLELFGIPYVKAPFEDVVTELMNRNLLMGTPARVTIVYAVRDMRQKTMPVIYVKAQEEAPDAYSLGVYPRFEQSYLQAHRTLSDMHLCLAIMHAVSQGMDGALMLDEDGFVRDSTLGGLLFSDGKGFYRPKTEHALPYIALDRAEGVLPIRSRQLSLDEAMAFPHAYVLSTLMGMRPVVRIGEAEFEPDLKSCDLASLKIL